MVDLQRSLAQLIESCRISQMEIMPDGASHVHMIICVEFRRYEITSAKEDEMALVEQPRRIVGIGEEWLIYIGDAIGATMAIRILTMGIGGGGWCVCGGGILVIERAIPEPK